MATREFDATVIYEKAKAAITGVPVRIEERWREICKDDYERQTRWYATLNNRLFSRWGWRKKVVQKPFEQFVEDEKTEEDYWGYKQYDALTEKFNKDLYELRRIRNLADDHVGAGKLIRINDDEFNNLRFYEKYAP